MPNLLVTNNFYISTSDACIVDLTPPVFAGINFLDVESRGQIRAGWSAATDSTLPIRYEIYIQATTAVGLFSVANIISVTPNLQYDIFTMPDGSFLVNGTTYHVGVRAIDGVSNRDSNTVSMNVISTGVLTSIDIYETKAVWSINNLNQFDVTIWANKNGSLAKSPEAVMGTASFQVYDEDGNIVVGMSGSGVSANSEGLYVFPSVANSLDSVYSHYEIKVTISIDGENRSNMVPVYPSSAKIEISGIADANPVNGNIFGSFWLTEDSSILTTGLGNGSYQVYTANGILIPGLAQTGIVPDVNGNYVITPLALPAPLDPSAAYVVLLEAVAKGKSYSTKIILGDDPVTYQLKSTLSINGSNMLQGSLWAHKIHELVATATLGTASYTIYDKNGIAVSGLTESGITADANGAFHITPVSAILLTDLTHFLIKIVINIGGFNRTAMKGLSLLGN